MYFKFLGTGGAAEIPVFGCECDSCNAAKILNDRRRKACSAALLVQNKMILIDAGLHDLIDRYKPCEINAFLLTHYHMDHVQGLFRLRWGISMDIPVFGPPDKIGCDDLYKHPGILNFHPPFEPFEKRTIENVEITALPLNHSKVTYGYLIESNTSFKNVAYLTDTSGLPSETIEYLKKIKLYTMVIDCSHPPQAKISKNHNNLDQVKEIIAQISPVKTYLTHISHEFDNWLRLNSLPAGVEAAYDGLQFQI